MTRVHHLASMSPEGLFAIRLRRKLGPLKTHDQRITEAMLGRELPGVIIPARTTLHVLDIFSSGLYCMTDDGQKLLVDADTCRESAYIPRGRTS